MTRIGLDISKNMFRVHDVDKHGRVVVHVDFRQGWSKHVHTQARSAKIH